MTPHSAASDLGLHWLQSPICPNSYSYFSNVRTIATGKVMLMGIILDKFCGEAHTLQPLYNTVHYNTVLDITRFKDRSQKCIDYIEK